MAMTPTIDLPDNLQAALRAQANAQGVSEEGYIRRVLERDLAAPPAEAMDADRDMLQRSERAAERIRELRKGNNPVHRLAVAHRLASYDAAYLELAMRRNLPLATLDNKLIHTCKNIGQPLL
jgi:plasmid stability protein